MITDEEISNVFDAHLKAHRENPGESALFQALIAMHERIQALEDAR